MRENIHFRRTPDYIFQELRRIPSQHIVAAAFINVSKKSADQNAFKDLGITFDSNGITFPSTIEPDKLNGLYARRNRNGIVRVLKHLPKVTKTYSWETPNFGDSTKGTHTVYVSRLVYQRALEPPRDWSISLTMLNEDENSIRFKCQINTILDRQRSDFENDLFFAINLLQEQFRDCHVFDANMSDEEIAKATIVGWEIFPPGTRENTLSFIFSRMRNKSPERQHEITSRMDVLDGLHPTEYIYGEGMDSRYFGAKFGENIVAFENVDYGNALYILFDNWQEISKMSRIDILKRHERDFIRIIHKKGWESALKRHLDDLLKR